MKNKTFAWLVIMIFVLSLSSGCLDKTKNPNDNYKILQNDSPIGIINAPEKDYFNNIIKFDASESYDLNGKIVSYSWDFGDGQTEEGMSVNHIYDFENNFTIEYPIIYPVCLFLKDDNGAMTIKTHQIKIYPNNYIFYLDSRKLTVEKPISGKDNIRGSGQFTIDSPKSILYSFDNPINIPECDWNLTIYLEKALLIIAKKIKINLFDSKDKEIIEIEKKISNNFLWTGKSLNIEGNFYEKKELKSLKITIYGFSIRDKIFIIYGGDKASQIQFNFSNI